jgi:hypothetical protein
MSDDVRYLALTISLGFALKKRGLLFHRLLDLTYMHTVRG